MKTVKELKQLFKSLGIDIKGLTDYKKLYNTTPYTFAYKGDSAWFCSYNPKDKTIEINTKYFDINDKVIKYNNQVNKS